MMVWCYTGLFGFLIADAIIYTRYWTDVTGNQYGNGKRIYLAFISILLGYFAFTVHMFIIILWISRKY